MVGSFGEVQVMDWGLAKVLAEGGVADEERAASRERERPEETTIRTVRSSGSAGSGTDTEAGSLLGTPAYMPPEQANGYVDLLDRRADVFGLGAILCEILTGKAPYVGRSAEELRRKAANGDLADALARLDGCGADPELIALTKVCLSPEAVDRPKDAQAVAEGLTAYLDGVQQRLHQAELAEAEARAKAVEEAKRRRLTLALAATVLVALTLGGGGWLYLKTQRDARQAEVTRAVNETLNQVTALREQARTASVGGAALFAQAREQAQRALALVESGPAEDTLKTQVRQLQEELDDEERDRTLVAALDEARLAQAETLVGESRFADERAVPKFREAFRAYGLAAGEGEPKAAAERIRQRPAAVRQVIVAALDEWDDLAGNSKYKITEPHREWLGTVLEATEPDDAWGRKVRVARRESDAVKRQAALETLAKSATVAEVPARALTRLAHGLRPAQAAELLRRAQRQYPADFWVNHNLGWVLREVTPPEKAEAVRFLTAAVALRPESPGAHLNLGIALGHNGRLDEAIACCRKAIELDPKLAAAHTNLGNVPYHKGQWDEAIACYNKAIELDPKFAKAHFNLGAALYHKGQFNEAIACFKKASELDPNLAGDRNALAQAQRMAAVQGKLAPLLKGKFQPSTNDERLALSELCTIKKRYRTSGGLYADAFAADPKLADNLTAGHRYNAACNAALAAAGQGEDAAKLDDKQRARLRRQALDWLRADLALRRKQAESGEPTDRVKVAQALQHWQRDADLIGIREAKELAKLPTDERQACEKLWADVAALLKGSER
jgi:serine/threonine-protein kinase